jgi:hypothetical protein
LVRLFFIPRPNLVLLVGNSASEARACAEFAFELKFCEGGVGGGDAKVKVEVEAVLDVGPRTLLALTGLGASETVLVFLTLSVAGVEANDETLEGSP